MRNDLIVKKSIEINAAPSKVWEALTNPELIKEYLFGTQTITDWKVGSQIIFRGEYKEQTYQDRGIILENILNKLISYSYWSSFSGLEDKPENYSAVSYTLDSSDNKKTTLTWTQKGFASEDNYKHSQSGMNQVLEKIKEVVEKLPA